MKKSSRSRRALLACLGGALLAASSLASAQNANQPWVGTWSSSAMASGTRNFGGQTLRQIVHTSVAGTSARVHISNLFSDKPLTISHLHIALRDSGSSIKPETDKTITFGGLPTVTIPVGGSLISDGVDFTVPALTDVAISFYVVSDTNALTGHQISNESNYAATGDVAGQATIQGEEFGGSYVFLANLDVQGPNLRGAVAAIGASITEGFDSSFNANTRWPNDLASRIVAGNLGVGVLNQGISGNQLFTDSDSSGQSLLNRFDRDALEQPGVRWVIVSDDPINDFGNNHNPQATGPNTIAALQGLMAKAHAKGIKFICSTLTPYNGSSGWTPEGEVARGQVNDFIRSADSGCDGVIDQDVATHDPANPTFFLPAFNDTDHLHPNDAGYQAIANAVDLALFTPVSLPAIAAPQGCGTIGPGEGLVPGQTVVSCDGRFTLNMQLDGNLVLYMGAGTPLWASNTVNQDSAQATLGTDGDFVIRGKLGQVLFDTESGGQTDARLFVQGDGNMVIYNQLDAPVWSSGTAGF